MSRELIWICPKCGAISPHETEAVCEECGTPLICTNIPADEVRSYGLSHFMEWAEKLKEKYVPGYEAKANPYVPKCPTCGCPIIRPLTHQESNFHFAQTNGHANWACKTFVCLNCGYAW